MCVCVCVCVCVRVCLHGNMSLLRIRRAIDHTRLDDTHRNTLSETHEPNRRTVQLIKLHRHVVCTICEEEKKTHKGDDKSEKADEQLDACAVSQCSHDGGAAAGTSSSSAAVPRVVLVGLVAAVGDTGAAGRVGVSWG